MKFPSIFRTPWHQRFHFEPRYYDPIKEDIKQRRSRIVKELEEGKTLDGEFKSQIKGNFNGRFYKRTTGTTSAGLLQFFIMALLFGGIFGYIYFGEMIFYFLMPFVALFVYLRIRRIF